MHEWSRVGVLGSGKKKVVISYHEISLHELHFALKAGIAGVLPRPLDLVRVIVQPDDVAIREGGDLARGPADTAADVEDFHPRLEV